MDPASVDLTALIVNGPLAGVVVFLFREVQRLHKENRDHMTKQLELFQKVALKAAEAERD